MSTPESIIPKPEPRMDSEPSQHQTPDGEAGLQITLAFILPLVISLLITGSYPNFAESVAGDGWEQETSEVAQAISSDIWWYLILVSTQVVFVGGLLVYFRRVYFQQFPLRVSWLSVPVGVVGVALWIWLAELGYEKTLLGMLGFDHGRPAFNPYLINHSFVLAGFLVARFLLLSIANPIAEELFVRGWLIRWIQDPVFERLSFKDLGIMALLSASLYGVVSHPTEAIAAFVWFGLVTLLMRYTGSLWDCIVAHMITNFLLGVYVVWQQQWQLW